MYRMLPQDREATGERGRLYYAEHFAHDMLIDYLIGHLRSVRNHKEMTE